MATTCLRKWQAVAPYFPLALVSGLLLIGPFYVVHIERLFVFCGGWSNFIAFHAIARSLHKTPSAKARLILLVEALFLALILGFDLDQFLGAERLKVAELVIMAFIVVKVFYHLVKRPDDKQDMHFFQFWGLLLFSIILTVDMDKFISVAQAFGTACIAPFIGLPAAFVAARGDAWANLLLIPLVYLLSDFLIRRHSELAMRSLRLDAVTMFVGITCSSCGVVWFRHSLTVVGSTTSLALFESGSVAAVLLLTNWVFVLYVARPSVRNEVIINAASG